MPRAHEFRDAAARFETTAASLAREAGARRAMSADRFGLSGPAAHEVESRLVVAADELAVSSERYVELARECRRRADVCDDYADRLRRYWATPLLERLAQPYPQRPASWADA